MKKNYRWGILGAGKIADKFCTALNFVEGSEVHAVASRNEENAKAYADKFNATKYYTSYTDLVKDENVDIVYIATPHAFHYEHALLCFKNNKAVLCEKPMSLSLAQTAQMIAMATEKKLFFMEGMWTAFMPFMDKIKEIIKDDIIGIPQYINADFGFAAPVDLTSRLFDKALGGGSVMDVGIYPIFLATAILGKPVSIQTASSITETGVDASANIMLQFANTATANLLCSIETSTPIEAEIMGTKGHIKIHSPWFKATEISVHTEGDKVETFLMPHQSNGFEYEIEAVMYCLDNKLLQSAKMPHSLTLSLSKTIAEILQQAGVKY